METGRAPLLRSKSCVSNIRWSFSPTLKKCANFRLKAGLIENVSTIVQLYERVGGRGGERGERETEIQREAERDRHRDTDRETDRQRQTDTDIERR